MPTWFFVTLAVVLSTPVIIGVALIVLVRRTTHRRQHARAALKRR